MSRARIVTSQADRLTALRVAHAATNPEQPFELYAAIRLRVPMRHAADWWLLEDQDGTPVTSAMGYPLDLAHGSERLAGIGIGAVATHPDYRGRHHANDLCVQVMAEAEARGRPIGLLFSAIPPALYERLGFVVAPGHAWRSADLDAFVDTRPTELTPTDGFRDAEVLAMLYQAAHEGLHTYRDGEGFRRSCVNSYEDLFFKLGDPARGYVRLHLADPTELEVTEFIVPEGEEPAALAAVFDLAKRTKHTAVVGWMPSTPLIEETFEKGDRSKTLPMVRGYEDLHQSMFWSSDYF